MALFFYFEGDLYLYIYGQKHPTVTIEQTMGSLKMKPLPKQQWEICLDRREI